MDYKKLNLNKDIEIIKNKNEIFNNYIENKYYLKETNWNEIKNLIRGKTSFDILYIYKKCNLYNVILNNINNRFHKDNFINKDIFIDKNKKLIVAILN